MEKRRIFDKAREGLDRRSGGSDPARGLGFHDEAGAFRSEVDGAGDRSIGDLAQNQLRGREARRPAREIPGRAFRRLMRAFESIPERCRSLLRDESGQPVPLTIDALFGADYWRCGRRPLSRICFGLLLAPLAALLPTVLLAFLVYQLSESDAAAAWAMSREAGAEFFSALYAPMVIGGAIGGAALWILRLRSRRAFAATGAVMGVLGGALLYLTHGALPAAVAVYALIAGAISMLALRGLVAVRKPCPQPDKPA